MKFRLSLIALSLFLAGCGDSGAPKNAGQLVPQTPQVEKGPPTIADGFVLRPTIQTTMGTVRAGTAFPVEMPGYSRPIILTATHLLGPAGGLPRDVPAADLLRVVTGLTLQEAFSTSLDIAKPGTPIVIAGAAPLGQRSQAGDILAFWGPQVSILRPAPLAAATPKKGEQVWLAASVLGGAPATERLHAATVIGTDTDGTLIYRYLNPKLELKATSGAPVLNAAGEVVAINLGGGMIEGDLVGTGNPVGHFAPYLEKALGPKH